MNEYQIAFARADGEWDVMESFVTASDDDANAYAEAHYWGQEWYVLRDGININGGNQ